MRDANGNVSATFPSAIGIATRLAYGLAKEREVGAELLLRQVGLTPQQIEDPSARIDVKSQIEFLNLASTALEDERLGFHLALQFDPRMVGLFHYVLCSSDTLAEALRRGERYSSIVNEGVVLKLTERGGIGISLEYVGVSRHSDRHQIEFSMAILVRICRQLTNRHFFARSVSFRHRRGRNNSELKAFFGCGVEFGATRDEVILSNSVGQMPLLDADPYLNELLVRYCEQALEARSARQTPFVSTVENAIASLLPHGRARRSDIASGLGISRRTLSRRLAFEGVTFAGVLRNLRQDIARRHLADDSLSISEIAWLLGYQDVSAFTHAFKRWTGRVPRSLRKDSK